MGRPKTVSGLPDVLQRRALLYGKDARKADHRALAEQYYEAGRLADALDFFHAAHDEEGIERLRREAVESGDVFLLAQIERLTKTAAAADVWRQIARRAEESGKLKFARFGYEKAGDEEGVERLEGEA